MEEYLFGKCRIGRTNACVYHDEYGHITFQCMRKKAKDEKPREYIKYLLREEATMFQLNQPIASKRRDLY